MKGVAANLAMPELKTGVEMLEQTLKKPAQYEPEILAGFADAQNKVLESIARLREVSGQEIETGTV